jgi:hypothetical protein
MPLITPKTHSILGYEKTFALTTKTITRIYEERKIFIDNTRQMPLELLGIVAESTALNIPHAMLAFQHVERLINCQSRFII